MAASKQDQTSKGDAGAQKRQAQKASGSSSVRKYRDIIITTLITLVITGLFGDFVIKRNIQSYNRERDAFDAAPKEADIAFSEARDFYHSRLAARRSASQQIIKYIKDNDIAAFNAAYPAYAQTVAAWNDDHSTMADIILDVTQCRTQFGDAPPEDREAAFEATFTFHSTLDAHGNYLTTYPDRPQKALQRFLKESRFCPTFFLTKNADYSVHMRFRVIHRNIYNYLVNNHSECRLRHIRNLPDYYKACASGDGGIAGSSEVFETVDACTQRYDHLVNSGAFCANFEFDLNDYKVKDIEFNELDFYWGLGDGFFKTFRRDYILRQCHARIGFWGRLFNWDCEAAVTAYLEK